MTHNKIENEISFFTKRLCYIIGKTTNVRRKHRKSRSK